MKSKILFILVSCAALLSACAKSSGLSGPDGKDAVFLFSIANPEPAPDNITSRAANLEATAEERRIGSLVLLFFDRNPVAEEGTFAGIKQLAMSEVSTDAEGMHFHAGLDFSLTEVDDNIDPAGTYDVLVIANWLGVLDDTFEALAGRFQSGVTKLRDAKGMLIYDYDKIRPGNFLMSAQGVYDGNKRSLSVVLKRSVAKFVFNVAPDANFTLRSIRLGNSRNSTYVMDMQGDIPPLFAKEQIGAVSLLPGKSAVETYGFETYNDNVTDADINTLCLILEVTLDVDPDEVVRFYRFNLNTKGLDKVSQHIGRNRLYNYTFQTIISGGFPSPEEALHNKAQGVLLSEQSGWDDNHTHPGVYAPDGRGLLLSRYRIQAPPGTTQENIPVQLYWTPAAPPAGAGQVEVTVEAPGNVSGSLVTPSLDANAGQLMLAVWGAQSGVVTGSGIQSGATIYVNIGYAPNRTDPKVRLLRIPVIYP